MNTRERFNRIMQYQPVDRMPVMAFEPYEATGLAQWRREGLPADLSPNEALGIDEIRYAPLNLTPIPPFEQRIVAETETEIVQIDGLGTTVRRLKEAPTMYYGHIDHPVKNLDDWRAYARRFQAHSAGRIADDLDRQLAALQQGTAPVGVCLYPFFFRLGFYGLGMERFLTAFYDQPELIHAMFSFWSDLILHLLRPVLQKTTVDVAIFAEDLAYKGAPHISPGIYREFWLPYQDPIVRELQRHQVPLICLWSSGNFLDLLPLLLDHGFNCTWPLEQVAGMDPLRLRKRFGRDLRLAGGFAKEALIAGPAAIERETERLRPIIADGGFVPALDDVVPPEASLASYRYYLETLRGIRL